MDLNTYIFIWTCIIGLCLGSFYNVVILRSLSGESIVFPPSKCPKCNHKLYWWHNIPIFSYVFLRGKCYFCKEKISIQYPIIEFITMILFGFSFWKFGLNIETIFVIIWLSLLLIMTVTDIKENIVDCYLAIFMGISGLICAFCLNNINGLVNCILGMIAGVVIFEGIRKVGKLIVKTDVMGEADTYVAGAIGAVFGIYNLPIVLLLGLFSYALIFIPIFIYDKLKAKDYPTFIFSLFFIFSTILYNTKLNNYYGIALLFVSAVLFTIFMFKGINKKAQRILPYVPAFSMGVLLFVIFFTTQGIIYDNSILFNIVHHYLYCRNVILHSESFLKTGYLINNI